MDIAEITVKWLPLWALAGSAVFYVWNSIKELENNKNQKLFDLMKIIDSKELPMASTNVQGSSASMLVTELGLTKNYVEKHYTKL